MNRVLTSTQAHAIEAEVSDFIDAQADLENSLWADHCHGMYGKSWEREWEGPLNACRH